MGGRMHLKGYNYKVQIEQEVVNKGQRNSPCAR